MFLLLVVDFLILASASNVFVRSSELKRSENTSISFGKVTCPYYQDSAIISKSCHQNEHIPVPLPFYCPHLNSFPKCIKGKRINLKAITSKVKIGSRESRCSSLKKTNITIDKPTMIRIELIKEENVYAVFIEKNYRPDFVRARTYFDDKWNVKNCFSFETNLDMDSIEFFCYWNDFSKELVGNIGLDVNAIEVRLTSGSIDPCDFLEEIQVFSYPYSICKSPGAYANQTFVPNLNFYLAGQTISYSCKKGLTIEGHPFRTCQQNGTWSGNPPKCVASLYHPTHFCNPSRSSNYSVCAEDGWKSFDEEFRNRSYTTLLENSSVLFEVDQTVDISEIQVEFMFGDKYGVSILLYGSSVPDNFVNFIRQKNFTNVSRTFGSSARINTYTLPFGASRRKSIEPRQHIEILGSSNSGGEYIYGIAYKGTTVENFCPTNDSVPNAYWKNSVLNGSRYGSWSCYDGYYDAALPSVPIPSSNYTCLKGRLKGYFPTCTKLDCGIDRITAINTLFPTIHWGPSDSNRGPTLTYKCPDKWHLEGAVNLASLNVECRSQEEWDKTRIVCVPSPDEKLSLGVLAGIAGVVVGFLVVCGTLSWVLLRRRCKSSREDQFSGGTISVEETVPDIIYHNVDFQEFSDQLNDFYVTELTYCDVI